MRRLLDQNLSPRLLDALTDLYPGSTHARNVGLQAADDERIRRGNCSTDEIATLLCAHQPDLLGFEQDDAGSFLALG